MSAHPSGPPALHDRAIQDLLFIRRTMEGAASFTDVPGWGLVGIGATAIAAAPVAARQGTPEGWLAVWIVTAIVAGSVGGVTMWRKMRRRLPAPGPLLLSAPARKFLLSFWPALFAGALLTLALVDPFTPGMAPRLASRVLPGLWLMMYGVAITTAGAFSVRAVPLMGAGFMALGAITLFLPAADGDLMMALGFGALQIGFGVHIARSHGG
ncbi:hypothetical protein [Gemmatimonas phototrophica]|uniref:Uncharacterized protein n=1 Tax=Gemmatimonas phototrophica TaxID=1379270 RepID=A0A143BHF0_9BACT|nr:hypothetical protein [Gemmatimonas phototrophica]AMW04458.1 hypothetical protein GEMMAAP_05610 [Gemmatimonas phototrophica]